MTVYYYNGTLCQLDCELYETAATSQLLTSPVDRLHFARQSRKTAIGSVRHENRRTHAGSPNFGTSAHHRRSAGGRGRRSPFGGGAVNGAVAAEPLSLAG